MSKASRRKRRIRTQRRQAIRHKRQVAAPVLDMVPADVPVDKTVWERPDGPLGRYIQHQTRGTLEAYRNQPNLVEEHANHEHDTARGGYAHRQLFELIQNSADALTGSSRGRICLKLTDKHLYCADDGRAISQDGVRALMFSHLSPKRGTAEIGRFGLGFKAVLGVTDTPEFFSRSGSFRFDRDQAATLIRTHVSDAARCPVLRLPQPLDPWPEMDRDPDLNRFMGWAVNIVRLPLSLGAHEDLVEQFETFPAEFLLFVDHVSTLSLQRTGVDDRLVGVQREPELHTLHDRGTSSEWRLFETTHRLTAAARSDSRSLDDAAEVPIVWAAPLEKLNQPGRFWAFFPTLTTSLLAGILNAPWKTNEDRQNLLEGTYNEELIEAAADLIAASLTELASNADPARHLDALPRRSEAGDTEHSVQLRDLLNQALRGRPVVPDQRGRLHRLDELNYPPEVLTLGRSFATGAFDSWRNFSQRPDNWLHHSALTPNRLAAIERLDGRGRASRMHRAQVSDWLEQLVFPAQTLSRAIEASKAAIRTAVKVQDYQEANGRQAVERLGHIVLTADGTWSQPDPERLFLGGDQASLSGDFVHPKLEQHASTRAALQRLGLKPSSAGSVFKEIVTLAFDGIQSLDWIPESERPYVGMLCEGLWTASRSMKPEEAAVVIRNDRIDWPDAVPVRVTSGAWFPLTNVLLPGDIVPGDGSRDANVAVDTKYHRDDLELLTILGAVSAPVAERELSPFSHLSWLHVYQADYAAIARDRVGSTPRRDYLKFDPNICSGPLDPLEMLSEEGRARYTWRLLDFETTYTDWVMFHETQAKYPAVPFPSPAIGTLLEFGMVQTASGFAWLRDGVGESPTNPEVVEVLLSHPKADRIRQGFGIEIDLTSGLEPVGEDAGVPIVDVWPAMQDHLAPEEMTLQLVRCEGFRRTHGSMAEVELACLRMDDSLYVAQQADETEELAAVLNELGKPSTPALIEEILGSLDPLDVRLAVEAVRQCETDEERLLAAVGIDGLRRRLPVSLPPLLSARPGITADREVARAVIAMYHTGALETCKDDLQHLNPPQMWAGTESAVRFVQSLGFNEEWAGHRHARRDPFVEVVGPRHLPPLHGYQRTAVRNVRDLVLANGTGSRRGMLSMPTGSGKTRVAVQALVEAMRDGELQGGILWVADRDELCEQAVLAWQEVWASEGEQAGTLRISRMWGGAGKRPLPISKRHVIVASIQTLHSRFARQSAEYRFLSDFNLVVVDEAHRSIATSYTSVLQELGLTRWYRGHEPILIGLTATPYRGFNEAETRRLQHRYGHRRLDDGIFPTRDSNEVIRRLQMEGVLAMADHATIAGGEFDLSDEERALADLNPWLPRSVEERIALDAARTRRIVEEYRSRVDPGWPTLIFATSVVHSQIVAALLNAAGIPSRAVSGTTKPSIRRRVVQEFRSGGIKVLVNYGVFREGFDAPKTRAIVVARPVYSPNLYFQMIGRGLRGVKNGGNERCLVLNVDDNIRNFGQDLAFAELDWLWAN